MFWLYFWQKLVTCADSRGIEARAAGWDLRAKVKVGESQGAEDGLGVEGGEEPDEDEAGEQDEGGGEHGGFEQGLTKLFLWAPNRGGEEGEGTWCKAVLQIIMMPFVEGVCDS